MTYPTTVGRGRPVARRALLALSTILAGSLAAPVAAQLTEPAPVRQSVDQNGVDLFHGTMNVDAPELTIGGERGLSYHKLNRGSGWTDNLVATLNVQGSLVVVSLGGESDSFTAEPGSYKPTEYRGATLVYYNNLGMYHYTRPDGTVIRFAKGTSTGAPYYANEGRVIDITRPSGEKLTFSYDSLTYCGSGSYDSGEFLCTGHLNAYRIASVQDNNGRSFKFSYDPIAEYDPNSYGDHPDFTTWSTVKGVNAQNLNVSPGTTLASQSFGTDAGAITVADSLNRVTRYRMNGGVVAGVTKSGSTAEDVTVDYANGRVSKLTTPVGALTYTASDANGERTVTVTDPLKHATTYVFDIASKRMKRMTRMEGEVARTWSWTYDSMGRTKTETAPEGNYVEYELDDRGNTIKRTVVPKSGDRSKAIVTSAEFWPCTVYTERYCNQPKTTTDARGAITTYAHDAEHGQVMDITAPAANAGAKHLRTHYDYEAASSGYRVKKVSTCAVDSPADLTCVPSATDTVTSYGYDADGNVVSITTGPGVGSNPAPVVVTTRYDAIGNTTSIDGPLAGPDDTTRYRYDAARQLVGVVGPDPDGSGPLKHRAVRVDHDWAGRVITTEVGTVTGTSDAEWNALSVLQTATSAYDPITHLKVQDALTAGGAVRRLVQYGYDAGGRPHCTVVRIGLVASVDPCRQLGSDAGGYDQLTETVYGADDRVWKLREGGVDTATVTYTANGRLATVTDGESNRTSYDYDGFDRLHRTRYPVKARGANASITVATDESGDYEQFGYDDNGNVIGQRLRDGQLLGHRYDALNRLIFDDNPNTNVAEVDVTYEYDLLGRLKSASDGNGWHNSFDYDALGRVTRQYSNLSSNTLQYDAAGRMTRQTWGDGFHVTYEYDQTGAMTRIRENGGFELARFDYDDLGRRTKLTRGNGTVTTYGYDPASQLTGVVQDLAGSIGDLTLGLGYDGLGRINSRTSSNGVYAWKGHADTDRSYTPNGLNQYTQAGAVAPTYDDRGNVTGAGGQSYIYNTRNQLFQNGAGQLFYRNPMGLLAQAPGIGNVDYVGGEVATEQTDTVQRRYVHGPGTDEPLVWYEGAGTADRRWLHADERGSVVAITDGSGTATAINTYDEYGRPGTGNQGRFQYTGQKWIAQLGLYDYKARMYSPVLGRFMQPDPIGYADGLNLYAYVGGDPVNKADPSGTEQICSYHSYSYGGENGSDVVIQGYKDCYFISESPGSISGYGGGGSLALTPAPQNNCPAKPLPPASRTYPIPKGYTASSDKQNRFVQQPGKGGLQINPLYAQAVKETGGPNWKGVAIDLLKIAGSVAFTLRAVEIGGSIFAWDVPDVLRAGGLVAGSGGKTIFDIWSREERAEDKVEGCVRQ